jgi:hypothetical protein
MKTFGILASLLLFFTVNTSSQEALGGVYFGNVNQPGFVLHQSINERLLRGETLDFASKSVVDQALSFDSTDLPAATKLVMAKNTTISLAFIVAMVEQNDLFAVTKALVETYPGNASDVVALSVNLYPGYAQIAIDAAIITGEIEANDALIAAISAGADPTSVSAATAAGPATTTVAAAPIPLGAGIGSAGSGGGDSTASNN